MGLPNHGCTLGFWWVDNTGWGTWYAALGWRNIGLIANHTLKRVRCQEFYRLSETFLCVVLSAHTLPYNYRKRKRLQNSPHIHHVCTFLEIGLMNIQLVYHSAPGLGEGRNCGPLPPGENKGELVPPRSASLVVSVVTSVLPRSTLPVWRSGSGAGPHIPLRHDRQSPRAGGRVRAVRS